MKEGCFILPVSSRNWGRQGAADEEEEAIMVRGWDAIDGESESAMMRTRRLALYGMLVMVRTGPFRWNESVLNSREGSLVSI